MNSRRSISFPVLRVVQPIGEFFIGVINSSDLFAICEFDIRRIHREREFETYLGIQRELNPNRVTEIEQYVRTMDATFPTSIILAVKEECTEIDERAGVMRLREIIDSDNLGDAVPFNKLARVLDGQHRIAGLKGYANGEFQLNVTVFVGIDIADQANIFSTVNLAQTKVNKSLVYDLFALAETRSPQKTCHEIVVALNDNEKSPFYHKIKRLGVATEGRFGETLSQATFVDMLLPYISKDPRHDRDLARRGRRLERANEKDSRTLIFRNMFLDKDDLKIANIVWNYFDAVQKRWPKAWQSTGRGQILNRTNGFRGFMRFLRDAYLFYTTTGELVPSDKFYKLFKKVMIDDDEFTVERFKPGTSGETSIYRLLLEETGVSNAAEIS